MEKEKEPKKCAVCSKLSTASGYYGHGVIWVCSKECLDALYGD